VTPSVHPSPAAGPPRPAPPAPPPAEDADARWRRIRAGEIVPGDYLPVTPEVTRAVETHRAFIRTRLSGEELDEAECLKLLQDCTLRAHYGGRLIAALRRPEGVIVLAVGPDEVGRLVRTLAPGSRSGFAVVSPLPL
jgi:hypothetical protein